MTETDAPRPYVVASPLGAAGAAASGSALDRFDPHRVDSEPFLDRVERLAATIHAGSGFPRWALYDCAEVSGGIFGEHRGGVPVSMCVAVPLLEDDAWHVHSLGADGGSVASALDVAVTTLGARRVIGTTAWSARDLAVHASLGPLEVLTAWTPAHTDPATLTYRVDIGTAPGVSPTTHVASGDHEALRRLQASIESGCRYRVVGPPGDDGRVPLAQDA